jgi:hypothetical protein
VVAAFSPPREGDFEALLEVLDPDAVLRADVGPPISGGSREVRGAVAVAGQALDYSRLDLLMKPALINGAAGLVSTRRGEPFSVGASRSGTEKIVAIDILADPAPPPARPDNPRQQTLSKITEAPGCGTSLRRDGSSLRERAWSS